MGFERETIYTFWLQCWVYPVFSFPQERHLEVGVRDVGLRSVARWSTDLLIVLGPVKSYKCTQGECVK